jgi:5'-nucleotidase
MQDESNAPDFSGEIVDETRQMSPDVDVVIAGHSHSRIDIHVPNADGAGDKLIVEAQSYGVAFDLVDMTIDRRTDEVVAKTARIPLTAHDVRADARMAALVEGYRERVEPVASKVLGQTDVPLTRANGRLAQLAADAERELAGADAAVVDQVAVRADIDAGPITYGELAEALAFDHPVVRVRMTGARLRRFAAGRSMSGPGELDPDRTYTVAASEMMLPHGRAVGAELQAVTSYLER